MTKRTVVTVAGKTWPTKSPPLTVGDAIRLLKKFPKGDWLMVTPPGSDDVYVTGVRRGLNNTMLQTYPIKKIIKKAKKSKSKKKGVKLNGGTHKKATGKTISKTGKTKAKKKG